MSRPQHRKSHSRMRDRPSRLVTISFGIAASVVGIFLEQYGVSWKYSEIGFGTIILVFCLLSGFRPEWQRRRFWLVMAVIVVPHLTGWVYLANRIERFGFALGFILLIGEIVVGAGMIFKAIPEDYQVMVDYIYRR